MTLYEHLRIFLISEGVGRMPTDLSAPNAEKPPIWIMPRFGTPAPGQTPRGGEPAQAGVNSVLAIYEAPGIPSNRHEGFMRIEGVDIRLRVKKPAPYKDAIYHQLLELLHDQRGWLMNGMTVQESLLTRAMQPIEADEEGWTYTCGFIFYAFEHEFATP